MSFPAWGLELVLGVLEILLARLGAIAFLGFSFGYLRVCFGHLGALELLWAVLGHLRTHPGLS